MALYNQRCAVRRIPKRYFIRLGERGAKYSYTRNVKVNELWTAKENRKQTKQPACAYSYIYKNMYTYTCAYIYDSQDYRWEFVSSMRVRWMPSFYFENVAHDDLWRLKMKRKCWKMLQVYKLAEKWITEKRSTAKYELWHIYKEKWCCELQRMKNS